MVFDAARRALGDLFRPDLRHLVWKSLGLSVLALVALWFAVRALFAWLALPWFGALMPDMPEWTGWLSAFAGIAAGVGLAVLLAFLVGPVSAAIAGLFLDDVAEAVEKSSYPDDGAGRALPVSRSVLLAVRFFGVVILGNLLALALLLVPLVNIAAFVVVNAYLLGREYFEFAAMRFRTENAARNWRAQHSTVAFMAGLVIAGYMAVPLLNLTTPFFAAAMMVHLNKALSRRDMDKLGRFRTSEPRGTSPS